MWIGATDRKGLLDLIGSKKPFGVLNLHSSKRVDLSLLDQQELLLIWERKPGGGTVLPEVICVSEGKTQDFLAWASTYLSSFRPFTAYCRVLDSGRIKDLTSNEEDPSLESIEGAVLGVIIGESITHYENQDMRRITPTAIMSTYSFAMARACALGMIRLGPNSIREQWERSRKLCGQAQRKLRTMELEKVWHVLTLLSTHKIGAERMSCNSDKLRAIAESCRDLPVKRSIGSRKWAELTEDLPILREVGLWREERREQRVLWFEECVKVLQRVLEPSETLGGFLCGYLASQIAPGSMKHVELLLGCMSRFPSVIAWYGLCAGLYQKSDVYSDDSGLGWRIRRDLLQRELLYSKPRGDISVDELELLLSGEKPDKDFRAASHTHIVVEILPRVYTVVIWPVRVGEGEVESSNGKELKMKASDPLTQMGEAIEHARELYQDVVKDLQRKKEPLDRQKKRAVKRKDSKSYRYRAKRGIGDQPMLNLE